MRKSNSNMKVELYIVSLWLLFLLIFILRVEVPISFEKDATFIGCKNLFLMNIIPLCCLIFIVLCFFLVQKFKYKFRGTVQPNVLITYVKNKNYEFLTFLTTYILPLVCLDLSNIRYVVVLVILLLIIGIIFVKMDCYLGNPTLALLGFRLYNIKANDSETEIIVITKDILYKGSYIEYLNIDKNVWYARECKNLEERNTKNR